MNDGTLPLVNATLPLVVPRASTAPIAWHRGQPISAARFLAEAQRVAATLPRSSAAVNLCQDRYRFALGLAAALQRGHLNLLPPNALPETLRQLPGAAPYAFVDDEETPCGGLERVVIADLAAAPQARAAALEHELPSIPALPPGQAAVCLLTSGSTGVPTPHLKRWGPLVANIAAEAARLAEAIERPSLAGLSIVATVPPQHSYGLESSVLLALLGGAAFDSGRPFYPADIVAALERVPPPRALVTTPFHLKTLLLAGIALPAVDLVLSATAPLSPQLAEQAESRLRARLVEIYGCTEAGQVASRRTTAGEAWTTLGELRVQSISLRASSALPPRLCGEGFDAAAGDDGFIVSGGHVVEPTPLADILELIDERRFRLLGRSNDLIHVAGKRSSLAHLNFHLNRIPGVVDGAFWLPDAPAGDAAGGPPCNERIVRPVAFVVAPELDARAVIAALRERLEPAFVPRQVVLLPALPREDTGKITAAMLRRLHAEHIGIVEQRSIAADHPAFNGHFPGQPVLPGVVLLAWVQEAAARHAALAAVLGATPRFVHTKFLAPVRPGSDLLLDLRLQRERVTFEIRAAAVIVARGQIDGGA